ncbi:MAG: hypothetical protein ACR2HN_10850 [Tepidiformaceae bacterium]
MGQIEWTQRSTPDGLRLTVGHVDGAEKYFIANVGEADATHPRMWRLGVAGSGLIANAQGEVKWFTTLAGARSWANRREHRLADRG